MKRILVAVDGSDNAGRALDMALTLSNKFGAELLLAYAVPPVPIVGEPTMVNLSEVQREQEEYGKRMLDEQTAVALKRGGKATGRLLLGPAAEALAELAESEHVDMTVVGSRGRNAVARLLLGSVSTRLIHLCKSPVLVVH
jgi:nucleotide-binding universal stress UspA family protein